jgi:hypothetical protein
VIVLDANGQRKGCQRHATHKRARHQTSSLPHLKKCEPHKRVQTAWCCLETSAIFDLASISKSSRNPTLSSSARRIPAPHLFWLVAELCCWLSRVTVEGGVLCHSACSKYAVIWCAKCRRESASTCCCNRSALWRRGQTSLGAATTTHDRTPNRTSS